MIALPRPLKQEVYPRIETKPRQKQRLPEKKSVTIGFGCLCEDGMVLGADTQLTAVGYHKSYDRKILTFDGGEFMDAAMTYAGSPVFADDFRDNLGEKILGADESVNIGVVKPMISSVLSRYVESDVHNNQILIAARTEPDGGEALFRTSGYSVSAHFIGQPVFIGLGDSSALALAMPLLSRGGVVSMQQAALVAFVLIEIAKKYIDGCGGETDILMIPSPSGDMATPSGEMAFLTGDDILSIENIIAGFEGAIGNALSRVFIPSTEEERDKVIKAPGDEMQLTGKLLELMFKKEAPQAAEESESSR